MAASPISPDRPTLAIVASYRDRAEHLARFEAHLRAFFTRDAAAAGIPYRVIVVEQAEDGAPFNRGMLLNIGVSLAADTCDYVAFHDIDYLPLQADYSAVDRPTPLAWYGAETRPVAPGRSTLQVAHDLDHFYGGALLAPCADIRTVDGFSNGYWGWGWEDTDLRWRFERSGLALGRRRGRFLALDHDSAGYRADGSARPIAEVNAARFRALYSADARAPDGLSTLAYDILARRPIPPSDPDARPAEWERVTVALASSPTPEQLAAHAAA